MTESLLSPTGQCAVAHVLANDAAILPFYQRLIISMECYALGECDQ